MPGPDVPGFPVPGWPQWPRWSEPQINRNFYFCSSCSFSCCAMNVTRVHPKRHDGPSIPYTYIRTQWKRRSWMILIILFVICLVATALSLALILTKSSSDPSSPAQTSPAQTSPAQIQAPHSYPPQPPSYPTPNPSPPPSTYACNSDSIKTYLSNGGLPQQGLFDLAWDVFNVSTARETTISCYPLRSAYKITSSWARFVSTDGTCDGVDVSSVIGRGTLGQYSYTFRPSYDLLSPGTDPCPGKNMKLEAVWCCNV